MKNPRVINYAKPATPFLGADFSNITGGSDFDENMFSAEGYSSNTGPSKEEIAAAAKAGLSVAELIAGRKRNEYKQALKNTCGVKPIGIGKAHQKKLADYNKCKSNFTTSQAKKNPEDEKIIKESVSDTSSDAGAKILGMKPIVFGVVAIGVVALAYFGFRALKGKVATA
jgi:hypothetical protein